VVLTTARSIAQTAEGFSIQPQSSVDQPPQASVGQSPQVPPSQDASAAGLRPGQGIASPQSPPAQAPGPAAGEAVVADGPISLDGSATVSPLPSLSDFQGYRGSTSSLDWIPGGGDRFGMFSIESDHYQKSGVNSGIGVGLGFHFLAGPEQTDMPPRVYDFSLAYQVRKRLGPLGFDAAASVLAASDFEGSARKGILFPSHLVGFLNVRPEIDVVFGVDYLDRGDIKLLPVAGLNWTPNPELRFELVFPRPRVVFQLTDRYHLYLSGELGGGSWAIERPLGNDLATYRDLRVCIGVENVDKDGWRSAFEIGYLFDRRLEYSSGIGDMHLDDAVILRLVTRF
jgi:hypothetical protein